MDDLRMLSDRLSTLERQNRTLRRVVGCGVGVLALAGLTAAAQPGWGADKEEEAEEVAVEIEDRADAAMPDTLRVKRIEILNDDGEKTIVLSTNDNGQGVLAITDNAGQQLSMLASVTGEPDSPGPVLVLQGQSGEVSLLCLDNIGPVMLMEGKDGENIAFVGPTDDGGAGYIELSDAASGESVKLSPRD